MRRPLSALACVIALLWFASPAEAEVVATINLKRQEMIVSVNGVVRHRWPVSTARRGYRTPVGHFRPVRLERTWYSSIYNNAPMPYSVFFRGGYAIHGTTQTGRLGQPASHGCVRLHTANARQLFYLIRRYGPANSRIRITG
ncbi:MAG TPA: L,D-transpeptidase [Xanthobacteraceae bacterium]|nr:L,D-transpeptidase [Xanthobacteraceae bacterium]